MDTPVLVAITDPIIYPEAMHAVAATGRVAVDTTDPREITVQAARCGVVLCDATTAPHVATLAPRQRRFLLLGTSEPSGGEISAGERGGWKLAMDLHAEQVFSMPADVPKLLEALAEQHTDSHSPPEESGLRRRLRVRVIAVLGGVGGAGTSVFAASVARHLAGGGGGCVLLDAATASGGLDLLFGLEDAPGLRWNDFSFSGGALRGREVLDSLIDAGQGLRLLSQARSAGEGVTGEKVRAAIDSLRAQAGISDIVVDAGVLGQQPQGVLDAVDAVVLVVPAEVRAVAAAAEHVHQIHSRSLPLVPVVRVRGWASVRAEEMEPFLGAVPVAQFGNVFGLAKRLETVGLGQRLPGELSRAAKQVVEAEVLR
ncbi:pilus assembly protein [Corynebacterium sp. 153RC1]|uniref:septum site-determining protein Ssd n=1 Tax=unclassified Corynebacterium TaxID=2624378 RepID=UPI00211BE756|nr:MULTISPECIES: septum site-determining protein Ssd [unclassified Corynebacterium]MCQ9351726.1 pilus assembly protein [Corynebacterium sp. 209RC1]MCQ9354462.1 pilus assembly protein [Corynebacterium sp. 1222RC1]MCQ9356008.1 pilus assembly protein [Corynebacterium sp. 122RC1]MCQ9358640.1 pilus assembly protein [Corynebacterium sp. 142RC1]MCQ9360622.1 pilus assembly protein [Corynebacterium sp. 153RC1]